MRKNGKRLAALIAGLILAAGVFAAPAAEADGLKVVTVIFPVWDWTCRIMGEGAEPELLVDNGADPHSYQASVEDILKIAEADVLIYTGGESEAWVEEAMEAVPNPARKALKLLDALGARTLTEETVEGMEAPAGEEEAEDEHVWLSLKNAEILTAAIAEVLAEADPAGAERYRENARSYGEQLQALDARYEQMIAEAEGNTLLFADRFPFRYLTEDYGLNYYAAFQGCQAECEASFETVIFLADKLDELGLKAALIIDGSDGQLAETIISVSGNPGRSILTLDSLQNTSRADAANGRTYLSAMEGNLEILRQALAR